jgi:hypothetical protein
MCLAVVEFFVELTRCYYVERKVAAILTGVFIFLGLFFGLQSSSVGEGLSKSLITILSVIIALVGSNLMYVMTSESFCNFCSGSADFGGGQNAFQAHGRARVGV